MAKALPLPDGTTVAIREGETPAQTWARAQQMYPEAFGNVPEKAAGPGPRTGLMADVMGAGANLLNIGRTGIAALTGDSTQAAQAGVTRQEELQKKYKSGFDPDKITAPFDEGQYGTAAGEALKQVPTAVANVAPSLAQYAASAAAGRLGGGALGSFFGPVGTVAGAQIGQYALPAVIGFIQALGSQAQDKVETQIKAGEKPDVNALELAPYAAGSAAVDLIGARIGMPSLFKKMGGVKVAEETADAASAAARSALIADARKVAGRGTFDTILRGTGGFALGELPTEVLQDVIDRAAVGKALTDDEAIKSYRSTALMTLLAAPLGGGLGVSARSGARDTTAAEDRKEKLVANAEAQRVAAEAAAKDVEFKKSPDYALKVADDYAAAEKAKAALLAQKRTIVKGSPTETADKAFNTIITKQLQAQAPELKALGDEYVRLEPVIKQATEQKRTEALTPEEYSLEQMQADVAGAAPRRTRDERLAVLNQPIPEEETAPSPDAAYAEERLALARAQITFTGDIRKDAPDYVDYLMTDPRMAQTIVNNQTALPGFTRKEQTLIRDILKVKLAAFPQPQAGTAASQVRVGTVEEEEQAAIEAQRAADEAEATRMETERADAQRTARLAPEVEGIKRLGKVPEGAFSSANADAIFRDMYLKQADEERVDQLLATLPMSSITTPGKIYAGLGFETASRRDLLTRIAVAKAHTGTEDVAQLREALAKLDAEAGSKANMSERLPGEGLLPEAEKKTIAAEKLADQQSRTLQEYIQFLEDKKRGKPRGTLRLGRKERLETAGDEFKAAYAKQHVDEVNARLDAFGLPQLTETEVKIATGRVMRNLNELGERWTASSAAAPGLGTFAAPVKAMEVLQEQIRSGMFKTINDAAERLNLARRGDKAGKTRTAEGGARIATPDELKLRAESTVPKDDKRIATELATQLRNTLDQRTYARPEQPAPKGKEGSNRADMALTFGAQERGMRADIASRAESLDEDTKDFVRLAADTLDQIKDESLITRLKEGLQDVAEGRKVSALTQQELKDFVAARAKDVQSTTRPGATPEELQRTSAQPQMSLAGFDEVGERTQRATPKNFQKMLDSKDVQGMRAAIAKMRTDNIVAIQEAARNTPAALRAARTAKARVAYNAALAQEQKNVSVISKLKAVFTQEREGAREVVDALQNQLVGLQKRIDEVAEVRSMLGKETNDMALMIQAPSVLGQEKALQKRLKETQTALDFAKDLVVAVDKQNAASATLYDMLTKEVTTATEVRRTRETGGRFQAFEKQQRRGEQAVEDARKELDAAKRAEREAAVEVKETKSVQSEFRDTAQRAREGLDLPGLRSTVDTTKMRTQISNIRSAMGSLDAQLNAETDPVKKAAIQAKIDATAAKLETVYADAPRITTAIAEKDQLLFEQTFDDIHIAAYDKQMAKARIKGGEYGPALSNRRQGTVDRPQTGGRIVQTGEKRATPASEMAGSALERVAQERAALRELEDRVAFLRANGKDKVKGRLTDAFKALQEKVAKQKAVVTETEDAQKALVVAVRDVNKEERAEKARVRKAEVKAEADGVLFSRGPTTDPSTVNTVSTELKKYFKDLSRIKIYSSVDALISANPQYKGRIPTDARGFVDTAGNKAFLIAENIDQGQALGVLLHEVGAHVGLKNILGESQYTGMVNAIKGWAKKNDGSVESVVAKEAIARVEAAKTNAKHRDDETLAYAIEEAVKAGVIPNQTKGVLGAWLSRIADGFRKLLTKFGMDLKSFDAQGLVDIAYGAAQMEMRAMPAGMSRRNFLRGAVSAVGQMYLPAVNTGLSINAKAKLFEATLNAADAWYSTVIGMAKTPALRNMLKDYSFDIDNEIFAEALYNADSDVEGVESLYSLIHGRLYNDSSSESDLIDLLESKPDAVEKLQMAVLDMRSQLVAVVEKLPKKENGEIAENKLPAVGDLLFSRKATAEPADALEALALKVIAQPKTIKEKLGSNLALQAEMNAADMRAGLRETLRFGDDNLFTQAMYHVRKAEQKMAQMFTVMNSGPLVAYKDAKGFIGYRSSNENSARDVFDAIADIPKDDPQIKTNVAQMYLVAIRANNKGLSKLDLGELGVTQEDLAAALAAANANPALKTALENVRRKYNAFNKGLIEFLASTGRITKKAAADLLKDGDYVPYYRVRDNGTAELNFGNNVTFNVGDIRRQPYLAELKGGETKLLPLNEAIQQNTLLLTDMALTNNAAKSVAYGLQALGKGRGPVDPNTGKPGNLMPIKTGPGPADARAIRFFQEPDPNNPKDTGERHLIVNTKGTAAEGIPAELVVQSLEGASLALPGFFKLGAAAADLLRAGVTRTPLYIARKLIREPMAAAFTGGLNSNAFSAVFKAGAEFVRMSLGTSDAQAKLIEKGLIQSNIFAGDMSDMKKMALQLASGKDQSAFDKVLAAADRYAMRADAATLALVLKNAEENGLSEVQADMMTMESMNFYKRGLSPTLQYASRLLPFFNTQIQGLSVLIKAARGNMPFEEQQQIKRKFFNNAMLLMATGLVYAMAMEDDETFRNARPRDKYSNFFLPIPFVDEPVKLPIPFEAGYFYSLAVAAVDGMRAETDGKAQFQALRDLFLGSIPGYSSMGMPALVKPAYEVWADKNFLTGGSVEPRRLQNVNTAERYLATTTELAKQMSKAVPILSPIQIEHIVRGYLGVLPLVAAAGANSLFEGEKKAEKPESRASELPLIGTAFQKKYGGGDADVVYREAQEAIEARNTFNKMLREGRREDAVAYRDENKADLAMASAAGQYRQVVGRINEDIRRTQDRTDLTPQEKRIRLDALDKAKQERADAFIQMSRRMAERVG